MLRAGSVEQRFVLPRRPELGGDLVIGGSVTSPGRFTRTANGWRWGDASSAVTLGRVAVFDATGKALPASMTVTASSTRIRVPRAALLRARYPVVVDPEIGANDFRISHIGTDGDTTRDVESPDVAYDPTANEYLVVWQGAPVASDYEVYGQRIDAATGAEVGPTDFQISDMGHDDTPNFFAISPRVAYNSTSNEYLVVWANDDYAGDTASDVFGQRVSAAGAEVGNDDFQISQQGGGIGFGGQSPALAYNATNDEYLVVWHSIFSGVFGQRLVGATGAETGTNDFPISAGPDEFASEPDVAYNPTGNAYLVVWFGDRDPRGSFNEWEIFGRRIQGTTGLPIEASDFRISDMGPDGNTNLHAYYPAVVHNPTANQYLVVWEGDDSVDDDLEIYGQRLDGVTAVELTPNDFQISQTGTAGDTTQDATQADVVYSGSADQYLVVWEAGLLPSTPNDQETEILAQRLSGAAAAAVGDDFRLSDMGPDGDASYDANTPAVAARATDSEYLIVWFGDDDTPPLVDNEREIFGQRYSTGAATAATLVSLTARRARAGVVVEWRTAAEATVLAFELRRSSGGRSTVVTRRPIPAKGVPGGSRYRVVDHPAAPASASVYSLYAIGLDGRRARLGSVRLRASARR